MSERASGLKICRTFIKNASFYTFLASVKKPGDHLKLKQSITNIQQYPQSSTKFTDNTNLANYLLQEPTYAHNANSVTQKNVDAQNQRVIKNRNFCLLMKFCPI